MARLNLDYYQGESEYSDGTMEDELLQLFESGASKDDFLKKDCRWPTLYHLSDFRQNILSWYPFRKDSSLLEVGAGCGALSGLFCRRAAKVTSVELTKRRSSVNYARNSEFPNLEIISGNFHNIRFSEKFDYIVLNGVLEYAASFTDTDNPYEDFLNELKKLLKPDGVILIAIENRLGMKYLNGAPEDHTSALFSGINDYAGIDFVRTFSKNELVDLITRSGFAYHKLYYPAPDYKFPTAIYTDRSVGMADSSLHDYSFNANRLTLFSEQEFERLLKEEKILSSFFNSFLIEVSQAPIAEPAQQIDYVKLPLLRKKPFCLQTMIVSTQSGKKIAKTALFPEAKPHLQNMLDYYDKNTWIGDYLNAPAAAAGEAVEFEFIPGTSLNDKLVEASVNENKALFKKLVQDYCASLRKGTAVRDDYYTPQFAQVFGRNGSDEPFLCRESSNVDMIFPNIITNDHGTFVIDYEWVFQFPVPVDLTIWRSLYMAFRQQNEISKNYSLEDLMLIAGLDPEDSELFHSWHKYFSDCYVADQTVEKYFGFQVNSDQMLNQQLARYNQKMRLYLDFGSGFNEQDSVELPLVIKDNRFYADFNFEAILKRRGSASVHAMRLDPCSCSVMLRNLNIENVKNDLAIFPQNAVCDGSDWYFYNDDPNILILGDFENMRSLAITGEYYAQADHLLRAAEYFLTEENPKKIAQLEQALREKEACAAETEDRLRQMEALTSSIVNSRSWKLTASMRDLMNKIRSRRER